MKKITVLAILMFIVSTYAIRSLDVSVGDSRYTFSVKPNSIQTLTKICDTIYLLSRVKVNQNNESDYYGSYNWENIIIKHISGSEAMLSVSAKASPTNSYKRCLYDEDISDDSKLDSLYTCYNEFDYKELDLKPDFKADSVILGLGCFNPSDEPLIENWSSNVQGVINAPVKRLTITNNDVSKSLIFISLCVRETGIEKCAKTINTSSIIQIHQKSENNVCFSFNKGNLKTVSLIRLNGKIVPSKIYKTGNRITIKPLASLHAGSYIICCRSAKGEKYSRHLNIGL